MPADAATSQKSRRRRSAPETGAFATSRSAGPRRRKYHDVPKRRAQRLAASRPAGPASARARRGGARGSPLARSVHSSGGVSRSRPATIPWRRARAARPRARRLAGAVQVEAVDRDARPSAPSAARAAAPERGPGSRRERRGATAASRPAAAAAAKTRRAALPGRAPERANARARNASRTAAARKSAAADDRDRPEQRAHRDLALEAVGAQDPEREDARPPPRAPAAVAAGPGRARAVARAARPGAASSAAGSEVRHEEVEERDAGRRRERATPGSERLDAPRRDASAAANAPRQRSPASQRAAPAREDRPEEQPLDARVEIPELAQPRARLLSVGRRARPARTSRAAVPHDARRSARTSARRPSGAGSAASAASSSSSTRRWEDSAPRIVAKLARCASRLRVLAHRLGSPSRSSRSSVIWKASPRLRA